MSQRHKDAFEIWNHGASNPRGVARALVRAIDAAAEEGQGTDGARNDPAVQMIIDHLAFLCGLPQPSLDMSPEQWKQIEDEVASRKEEP